MYDFNKNYTYFSALVEIHNMATGNSTTLTMPVDEHSEIVEALKRIGLDYEEAEPGDYGFRIVKVDAEYLAENCLTYDEVDTETDLDEVDTVCGNLDYCHIWEIKAIAAYMEGYEDIHTIEELDTLYHKIEDGDIVFYPDNNLAEVAEELAEEEYFGEIPENVKPYIDYELMGRDLGYEGYTETTWGVIYEY